mmetsp:Transcript_33947/g.77571  ORF Transcript_33947/g.77571 Transcript_33947/m.77571 type:complete len:100 (+) Transcript_33947:28-327(+)
MKFGQELKRQFIPEWRDKYLQYTALKKSLKTIKVKRAEQQTEEDPAKPPELEITVTTVQLPFQLPVDAQEIVLETPRVCSSLRGAQFSSLHEVPFFSET